MKKLNVCTGFIAIQQQQKKKKSWHDEVINGQTAVTTRTVCLLDK